MIKSFKHKGLEAFFLTGSKAGIRPDHASKLNIVLTHLDVADCPQDMGTPSWRLHPLKGPLDQHWAVTINGNWRLTFRFLPDGNVELVDYQDYH
ncbi:type II toxin-antitoxin system RelE/ParE family toxin [Iodobacter fluviatilis]|uniref:Killer protein n=1 Tax=Iodobacter fluviatilis TaxID=537 RepID=A0A7G3GBK3_9NEIS|nr:type II toxin-antitoxin system RelE/ParE family toxin [Iodobacter fluviatilis]QBC44453.1 Killer protein [Iodobacter fluviatilis]